MKRQIISLVLVQVLGLLLPYTVSATETTLVFSSFKVVPRPSRAELTRRFNKILDEKLSEGNVCITLAAARQLNDLMRKSAAEIVRRKAFNQVKEAEKNIRLFAETLMTKGTISSDQIRITEATVNITLYGQRNPHMPGFFDGLCPLFPICR